MMQRVMSDTENEFMEVPAMIAPNRREARTFLARTESTRGRAARGKRFSGE
jgi:hypothetical protein